jgi:hypothetical protein
MGVVFDEVVTQVVRPPQPEEPKPEQVGTEQSPLGEAARWERQQATFWRRQQRLEAD